MIKQIFFTNDIHSHLSDASAVLDAMAHARQRGGVVVDGGDFLGGNAFHSFSGGVTELAISAELYHAMALGNHDLEAVGVDGIGSFLCANLRMGSRCPCKTEVTFELDGVRVAMTAVIGREAFMATPEWSRRGLTLAGDDALAEVIQRLRASSDVVVLMSHSGFPADRELALRFPMVDVILSSHCHSNVYLERIGPVVVAKAPEHGQGFGVLTLGEHGVDVGVKWLNGDGRFHHPSLCGYNDDLSRFQEQYNGVVGAVSCRFATTFPGREQQVERLAELMRAASRCGTGIMNVYSLRAPFVAGPLSLREVHDRLPFETPLRRIPLAALPDDWRERIAGYQEPIVLSEDPAKQDGMCCVSDYVVSNVFGMDGSEWETVGSIRALVLADLIALFGATGGDEEDSRC